MAEVLLGKKESLYCPLEVARAQLLCTCGTYESSAIHDISEEFRTERKGVSITQGMTETVLEAYEQAALFSEMEVPWARPGEVVSLENYGYFPTFRPDVARGA